MGALGTAKPPFISYPIFPPKRGSPAPVPQSS